MSKCEASHIDQIVLGLYLNLAFSTTKYLDLLLSGKFLPCYFLASIQHLLPTFWALLFLYILFYYMYKFIKRLSQYSLIRDAHSAKNPLKKKSLKRRSRRGGTYRQDLSMSYSSKIIWQERARQGLKYEGV